MPSPIGQSCPNHIGLETIGRIWVKHRCHALTVLNRMLTTWFWSLVLFLLILHTYIFFSSGDKTQSFAHVKMLSVLDLCACLYSHSLGFSVNFPWRCFFFKMPWIFIILWETLVTCSQFWILGQELLKKCIKKPHEFYVRLENRIQPLIDVTGPTCTLLHSTEGAAAQRPRAWVPLSIIHEKPAPSGFHTIFFFMTDPRYSTKTQFIISWCPQSLHSSSGPWMVSLDPAGEASK